MLLTVCFDWDTEHANSRALPHPWSFPDTGIEREVKAHMNSGCWPLLLSSALIKASECLSVPGSAVGSADGRSYLPWLWLSSAWTVSPAPLQAARLESLLVNKPKAPAASTRDPTGFIIRSLTHFCCPPLQHKLSWASEQRTLCLATIKLGSSEQRTSQEPPALSSWALQRMWERHPQSQTVLLCKAHTTYTPNWVICKSLSTANNALTKATRRAKSMLWILKPYHRCYVQIFK